jgi:hypothetical protein
LNVTKGRNNSSSSSSSLAQPRQQQGSRETTAAGSNSLQFPAAASTWEQQALQDEMQRLLQHADAPPDHDLKTLEQQQQHQSNEASWDPLTQLSTVQDAIAYEEKLSSQPNPSSSSSSSDRRRRPLHPLLAQQQLFSVYVHTTAGLLLPPSSIFSGSELKVRLNTTRGYAQHVLAEAEVLMLRAALGDAANAKFVMVSDSSIPLYLPEVRLRKVFAFPVCCNGLSMCVWHMKQKVRQQGSCATTAVQACGPLSQALVTVVLSICCWCGIGAVTLPVLHCLFALLVCR